jgi:voltage-gated potassium channel
MADRQFIPAAGRVRTMVAGPLQRLLLSIYRHVAILSWPSLMGLVGVHFLVSWLGYTAAHEDKLSDFQTFWYFYAVTVTTIGYGDFTPGTTGGRLVTVFWVMPGGIALFTAVIAKLVQTISTTWTKRMRGEGDYSEMQGHLVILGWSPARTPRLVHLLLADKHYEHAGIVLVGRKIERNPMPEQLKFVRAETLSSPEALRRSAAADAEAVIAVGENDNETLAIGLAIGALERPPRIVAHFQDEAVAGLLRAHCPSAECSVSISVEMLARVAQDPGSSEVQRQIVSPVDSPTQFSLDVPAGVGVFSYGAALAFFKARHDATVIACRRPGDPVVVNARETHMNGPGDTLFVLSDQRIKSHEVDWDGLLQASRDGAAP